MRNKVESVLIAPASGTRLLARITSTGGHLKRSFLMRLAIAVVVWLGGVDGALAQTEGRISVGGSVTLVSPTDDDVDSSISVGPLVRLNP